MAFIDPDPAAPTRLDALYLQESVNAAAARDRPAGPCHAGNRTGDTGGNKRGQAFHLRRASILTMPSSPSVSAMIAADAPGLGRLGGVDGFRLRHIQNHLSRCVAKAASAYRLRSGALSALAIAEDNAGISQADIGRQIGMDSSAVVALIDELEQRGGGGRMANDHRRRAIHLEPDGRRTLDELFAILADTEDAVLYAPGSSERLMLNRSLDPIYDQCFGERVDG